MITQRDDDGYTKTIEKRQDGKVVEEIEVTERDGENKMKTLQKTRK